MRIENKIEDFINYMESEKIYRNRFFATRDFAEEVKKYLSFEEDVKELEDIVYECPNPDSSDVSKQVQPFIRFVKNIINEYINQLYCPHCTKVFQKAPDTKKCSRCANNLKKRIKIETTKVPQCKKCDTETKKVHLCDKCNTKTIQESEIVYCRNCGKRLI